jgi:hypothetical protein
MNETADLIRVLRVVVLTLACLQSLQATRLLLGGLVSVVGFDSYRRVDVTAGAMRPYVEDWRWCPWWSGWSLPSISRFCSVAVPFMEFDRLAAIPNSRNNMVSIESATARTAMQKRAV